MTALETNALTKRYDGRTVVDEVDVTVDRGEVLGIVGPNGAGKSTLLGLLGGRVRPSDGTATVLGLDPWRDRDRLAGRIGHLPEHAALDAPRSGREHLRTATDPPVETSAVEDVLDRIGVDPSVAARPVKTYSTGTARRIALGMALVGDPQLLLLDEPTTGLDRANRTRLASLVRAASDDGTTVVTASRRPGFVRRVADRVERLDRGELVAVDDTDDLPDSEARVRLAVDRAPETDLRGIPGVEDVVTTPGEVTAFVSTPGAKPTVVMEVAHAGAAIHDLVVEDIPTDETHRHPTDETHRHPTDETHRHPTDETYRHPTDDKTD